MTLQLDEITKLAVKLIRFRTVSGRHREAETCFRFIKDYLRNRKIVFRHYVSNSFHSIVISQGRELHKRYALLGHIDVVPAPACMFKPVIKNGLLYGRGAIDMKSQIAVMLYLFKHNLPDNTALWLTSDEELGGENGVKEILRQGHGADFFIAPDGGDNFKLITREKGLMWIKITEKGKSGHASRPWEGENAIEKLITKLNSLSKFFPSDNKDKWVNTMSIGVIKGGSVANKIPEKAEAIVDIRFTTNSEQILKELSRITDFKLIKLGEVFETDESNKDVKRLAATMESVLGKKIGCCYEHGASDARHLAEKGIPCALFNPEGGGAHTKEEYVRLKSLEPSYRILKQYLTGG